MKSFSRIFLGLFCVFQLSAQEIEEAQFVPQLEARQASLYEKIDEKDDLSREVEILSAEIAATANEDEKAKKTTQKEQLAKRIKELHSQIITECNDYREYHTFLAKYQNVSEKFLNNYKVRICQIYTTPEVMTEEEVVAVKNESYTQNLKTKEAAIEKLVDDKFNSDKAIALLDAAIKKLENELSSSTIEDAERKTKEAALKTEKDKKTNEEKANQKLVDSIQGTCKKFGEYKNYLTEHEGVAKADVEVFKARSCLLFTKEKELDPDQYIIVGDNKPVKVDSLFSNSSMRRILADVFSIDSQTSLGTFEIPGDESFVNFDVKDDNKFKKHINNDRFSISVREMKMKLANNDSTETDDDNATEAITFNTNEDLRFVNEVPEGALFKSIQIELREGGIVDTRLVLISTDKKFEFYFEGKYPVSILNYSRKADDNYLHFSHYVSLDGKGVYNKNVLKNLLVRYTEVLKYHPNAGSNYVPDDVSYRFPSDNKEEAIATKRRSYQVINNNHLQHVLDLRTYTDLLGLFGDEANGLFQIEGKADFFINPFNPKRTAFYYLKKISPYVRYSRFDEDNDFLPATTPTANNPNPYGGEQSDFFFFNNSKLDLLERSNLEMGLELNLVNFRLFKESPFWTSFYFPLSYNVTKVRTTTVSNDVEISNNVNFKTLGFGLGVDFEIRRFNNFGLNFGYELKGHSYIGDYKTDNLSEPGYLKTQAVKAEIFYYPGLDRSNSIFLRMKSIRDIGAGDGDSFFQLQVGYRFTLGVGAIRARQ